MKTFFLLTILLFATQLQASCRCSCNPDDIRLCASSYDLEQPCPGLCPTPSTLGTPGRTACTPVEDGNDSKGATKWKVVCDDQLYR